MNFLPILSSATDMLPTPDQLSTYFTYGFFAILLILVIGFLVGMVRGIWSASFRLLFVGILVILAFFLTRPIADKVATIDIKALLSTFGMGDVTEITFPAGSPIASIPITNVQEMITSGVGQLLDSYGLSVTQSAEGAAFVLALVMMLLRYIVFIIEAVLILVLGDFLAGLLYHLGVKWFIPKPVRKRVKKRLLAGFINTVKVALVTTMMMIPFSSLINTINQAVRDGDTVIVDPDNESYQTMMSFLNAYNDSTLAKVLFNWTANSDGKTLDVVLMDMATSSTLEDGTNIALSTELYNVTQIGTSLISAGILDDQMQALTTQLLTNEDFAASLIMALANSALIVKILPIAAAIALNLDAIQEFIDPSKVNLDNVNWHDELVNVSDITNKVIASGALNEIYQASANHENVAVAAISSLTQENTFTDIHDALLMLDQSDFLVEISRAVLYTLVTNSLSDPSTDGMNLGDFLPHDWDSYETLNLGSELALVYDAFYQLMNVDPNMTSVVLDILSASDTGGTSGAKVVTAKDAKSHVDPTAYDPTTSSPASATTTSSTQYQAGDGTTDDLITILRAHTDDIINVLVGLRDSNGEPVNVDENGKTILSSSTTHSCLLDSDLLMSGMHNVMTYALDTLMSDALSSAGITLSETTIDNTVAELDGATTGEERINYKREFGAVLGIVGALIGNDQLAEAMGLTGTPSSSSSSAAVTPNNGTKTPLKSSLASSSSSSENSNQVLDLIEDSSVRDFLKTEVFPLIDQSILMTELLPPILEGFVSTADFSDITDIIGLTADDFNFDITNVGTELGYFVDIAGYGLSLMNADFTDIASVVEDHADDLVGILDAIYHSNIINPKTSGGSFLSDNYYTILEHIFAGDTDFGFDAADVHDAVRSVPLTDWANEYDAQGNVVTYGENYRIVNVVETIFNEGLYDLMNESDILAALNTPQYDGAITAVFTAIDDSTVVSQCFGGFLDNLFAGDTTLVDPTGLGTSFRNVTDWTAEGENLEAIVSTISTFGSTLDGINFLDFSESDVQALLSELASSGIFDEAGTDNYLFGDFLYHKLIDNGFGDYLLDKDEIASDPSPYDSAYADFMAVGPTTSAADKAAWQDEITRIAAVIGDVGDLASTLGVSDGLTAITDGTASASQIESVVLAVNDCSIFRMVIYNVFDDLLGSGSLNFGSLNPADANTAALITMSKSARADEITTTLDIYDAVQSLDLASGFSAANLDASVIETMLGNLHDSQLFNTINEDHSRIAGDLTVFEETIQMILDTSTLTDYIYDQYPAAQHAALLKEDILALGNNLAGTTTDSDGWIGASGEIAKLGDVLQAFSDTGLTFTDFGTSGASAISTLMDTVAGTTSVQNLLLAIDHSGLMYPAIPNLFDTMLTSTDVAISGLDLTSANTHYTGDRGETPYPDTEITTLIDIFNQVKDLASLSYDNISALTDTTLDNVDTLLTDLYQSEIFHQQGAASGVASDPTVFEQMIIKIMNDSGISTQVNDTDNPNPLYYDGAVYKFANASEKMTYLVTQYETINDSGTLYTSSWDGSSGEITALIRIFKELKAAIPSVSTADIDTSMLSPTTIANVLTALNRSNIASDAVAKFVKDTLTDISFDNYTEGYQNYYLTALQYGAGELDTRDYSGASPTTTDVGLFHALLDGFWNTGTSSYLNMGASFSLASYVSSGHSTASILDFLKNSQILAPEVVNSGAILYKTRALVLYNWFDAISMDKYIEPLTTGTKDERATTLESIFEDDFDVAYEGSSLDTLVVTLDGLTSSINASSLDGHSSEASGMISATYTADGSENIIDRAYLTSELVAGFYTDIFSSEYSLAETNVGHSVSVIDFYANDYDDELNPREARGIGAVLDVVPEMNAIVDSGTTQAEVDALRASFVDMGSILACTDGGLVDGNSDIAQLIYASRIVANANFVAAKAAYDAFYDPDIEDDPYTSGFIFEVEGGKLCDYFETFVP